MHTKVYLIHDGGTNLFGLATGRYAGNAAFAFVMNRGLRIDTADAHTHGDAVRLTLDTGMVLYVEPVLRTDDNLED